LPAPDELTRRLERSFRKAQADQRLPSLVGAVVRDGETVWSQAVGLADIEGGVDATLEHQYRVGSITKTFTATAIMQLRDEGKLDLDDRLEQHIPGIAKGSPTLRRMLAHLSGLQREAGEMFVTGVAPTIDEIVEAMAEYEDVLPAAKAHHYSNLAYALLGEVVARRAEMPYTDYVKTRIFEPLGLERTTWVEQEPRALGYQVDEYTDEAHREGHIEIRGVTPMGQFWSTVPDLCRWVVFLAEGREDVLDPATADEMWFPQVMMNPDLWTIGWGLGLELVQHEGRIFGGHTGAMPGFLAGMFVNRETKTGAVVLTNAGSRAAVLSIPLELASATIELWPPEIEPWHPEPPPPAEVAAILGRWWSEGGEFVFAWRDGKLTVHIPGQAPWIKPSILEPLPEGGYRVASGREVGERLRVEGDRIIWGGYLFTREQKPMVEG
jgi:CubicO group peptidase (beta-lactamase class C family)